eukprot:CAMPEP_0198527348 /NCGR_PEP_ID=MMETSP1462-20131121/24501_1 /TAXON_ID=1333877 /ORGANISM="Brandtodinium nutriculum, Strain RCC3387" /LENGTH=322 /DNA_ID=CAMNT_0044257153 /DNA_START=34 /DNA_END=998 /DNA_ORIENTATION=-
MPRLDDDLPPSAWGKHRRKDRLLFFREEPEEDLQIPSDEHSAVAGHRCHAAASSTGASRRGHSLWQTGADAGSPTSPASADRTPRADAPARRLTAAHGATPPSRQCTFATKRLGMPSSQACNNAGGQAERQSAVRYIQIPAGSIDDFRSMAKSITNEAAMVNNPYIRALCNHRAELKNTELAHDVSKEEQTVQQRMATNASSLSMVFSAGRDAPKPMDGSTSMASGILPMLMEAQLWCTGVADDSPTESLDDGYLSRAVFSEDQFAAFGGFTESGCSGDACGAGATARSDASTACSSGRSSSELAEEELARALALPTGARPT